VRHESFNGKLMVGGIGQHFLRRSPPVHWYLSTMLVG
jgi:hypothetical protein